MSATPLFQVTNLSVGINGRGLLERFSLDVHAGELVALTGASGSGKTALLRVLAGLADAAAGAVRFNGRPAGADGWPAYRRRVVLVQQRPAVLDASVEVNLRRAFAYRAAAGPYDPQRAASLIERFGLGAVSLTQNARSLSVGEQQRVCLARALLLEPRVLLLDEPTSALDPSASRNVETTIAALAEQRGLAALIVTHDRAQADRWCHQQVDIESNRHRSEQTTPREAHE